MATFSRKKLFDYARLGAILVILLSFFWLSFANFSNNPLNQTDQSQVLTISRHADLASLDDDLSKKSQNGLVTLIEGISKLHFIIGLGMFLFIAMMVVENDIMKRALLLLPIVLLYWGSKVLFAIDQSNMTDNIIRRYRNR